jgi:potassium-transporting ATPase potassium-binding subunit
MTIQGWLQIVIYGLLVFAITKPLGIYLYRVFEGKTGPWPRGLGFLEHWTFRLCGVNPERSRAGRNMPWPCSCSAWPGC